MDFPINARRTNKVNPLVVDITIHEAEGLVARNSRGYSDPFCIIDYGDETKNSPVLSNALNPKWMYTASFMSPWGYISDSEGKGSLKLMRGSVSGKAYKKVYVTVYNKNFLLKNDFLGYATLKLEFLPSLLKSGKVYGRWHELRSLPDNKISGKIFITLLFRGMESNDYEYVGLDDGQEQEEPVEFPENDEKYSQGEGDMYDLGDYGDLDMVQISDFQDPLFINRGVPDVKNVKSYLKYDEIARVDINEVVIDTMSSESDSDERMTPLQLEIRKKRRNLVNGPQKPDQTNGYSDPVLKNW